MQQNRLPLPDAGAIRAEYEESSILPEEYQMAKWASADSMLSRFGLAVDSLPFDAAETWLDVGCGPGAFQALALPRFPRIACTGIDLSPALIAYAVKRNGTSGCTFLVGDFMECALPPFDIITCIGVLQRTNFSAAAFFEKASALLRPGGYLFLDTKTVLWEEFTTGRLTPDPHLQWFTLDGLKHMADAAGLQTLAASGFDPHRGDVVPEAKSPTIFLIAEKRSLG